MSAYIDELAARMRTIHGTERAALATLAAVVAAGIEANAENNFDSQEVADRAVAIAGDIVRIVAPGSPTPLPESRL